MSTKPLLQSKGEKRQTRKKQVWKPKSMKGHALLCETLQLIHEVNADEGNKAVAKEAKADAKKYGCGWGVVAIGKPAPGGTVQ